MESKIEFKKNNIKNNARYYFNYSMGIIDIDFKNVLLG